MNKMKKIKVLCILRLPIIDAASRHRIYQYSDILETQYDIKLHIITIYPSFLVGLRSKPNIFIDVLTSLIVISKFIYALFLSLSYKIIWILRDPVPFNMSLILKLYKLLGKRIIYDFDDTIYINNPRIDSYIKLADIIFAGNQFLANHAMKFNRNVKIIPTTLSVDKFDYKKDYSIKDAVIIGWVGSNSTVKYVEDIIDALEEIGKENKLKLVVVGARLEKNTTNFRVEYIPWNLGVEEEITKNFDIAIAPLSDGEWERGKCGFKIMEYMAAGVPVVASPIGIQGKLINDGVNGFLANSREEWITKLKLLIRSKDLRESLGKTGRTYVKQNFDIQVGAESVAETIRTLCG